MNKYKNVQFISWEIHTGPTGGNPTYYSGVLNPAADRRLDVYGQCYDIEARVAFTAEAIKTALANASTDTDTLKVFIAPEFMYRGAGGAYVHDLINGWTNGAPSNFTVPDRYKDHWTGLFGELSELVAKPAYDNWLFVFGTAVSASFPTLKQDGSPIDLSQKGEIYNMALIQRGGPDHSQEKYVSQKHYKSHIDFVKQYNGIGHHVHNGVVPLNDRSIIPIENVNEGGALFHINSICDPAGAPIDFGIEICLDHAESGSNSTHQYGRLRTAGQRVQIQLVPSGGMSIVPASVWLKSKNSYIINTDGLCDLATPNPNYGIHTQLWDNASTRIVEAINGQASVGTTVHAVAAQVNTSIGAVPATGLWNGGANGISGAGNVRVIKPLPL